MKLLQRTFLRFEMTFLMLLGCWLCCVQAVPAQNTGQGVTADSACDTAKCIKVQLTAAAVVLFFLP